MAAVDKFYLGERNGYPLLVRQLLHAPLGINQFIERRAYIGRKSRLFPPMYRQLGSESLAFQGSGHPRPTVEE